MKTISNMETTIRELKKVLKGRTEERLEFLESLHKKYKMCGINTTRGKDSQQIFLMAFQFDDSQEKLNKVRSMVRKIYKKYEDDSFFVGITYRYGGRKRYIHAVGPSTDELLQKVDGDLNYILMSVRFKDPEY